MDIKFNDYELKNIKHILENEINEIYFNNISRKDGFSYEESKAFFRKTNKKLRQLEFTLKKINNYFIEKQKQKFDC